MSRPPSIGPAEANERPDPNVNRADEDGRWYRIPDSW